MQQAWVYLEVIFSAPDIQRQLPAEAKMFTVVDKQWKEIMRKTAKVPLAMNAATTPGLLEQFKSSMELLDQIMKCLEAYLEVKRVSFPRFYFLSNDELLEILAQVRMILDETPCSSRWGDRSPARMLYFAVFSTPPSRSIHFRTSRFFLCPTEHLSWFLGVWSLETTILKQL